MMKYFKRLIISCILVIVVLCSIVSPLVAANRTPDIDYVLNWVGIYTNYRELSDQLYLIDYSIQYTTNPTIPIDETFVFRLMNGFVELASNQAYPYFNDGYARGIVAFYFSAASAPAWGGAYTVECNGNPLIPWTSDTATIAMSSAQAFDDPAYTDETAAANSAAANDMTILPAAPAVNDAYYFGGSGRFDVLTINVGTNGSWTGTYTWEYWTGSVWKALSDLTDGTTGFEAGTGNLDVTWTMPEDWNQVAVNGVNAYYVRFRVVTYSAIVTQPLGTQSWVNTLSTLPTLSIATLNWITSSSISETAGKLTTRIKTLANIYEQEWLEIAPTTAPYLLQDTADGKKFTDEGEAYFTNSIPYLREQVIELFAETMGSPSFDEHDMILGNSYYAVNTSTDVVIHSTNWFAQTFQASDSYRINGMELLIYKVGVPGDLTVSLRATLAGVPTGADLAVGTLTTTDVTTYNEGEWYTVAFTTEYTLTSVTTYALVVRAIAGNAANYVVWFGDSAGVFQNGLTCTSVNSGVAWAQSAAQDMLFGVKGLDGYSLNYRDRLAQRLIGTRFDMTNLGINLHLSRMWTSTLIWFVMAIAFAVFACKTINSFKPAMLVVALTLPFGALAGFIYLEIALLMAVLLAVAGIYFLFYNKSS